MKSNTLIRKNQSPKEMNLKEKEKPSQRANTHLVLMPDPELMD